MRKRHILAYLASTYLASNLQIPINPVLSFPTWDSKYDPHYGTQASRSLKSGAPPRADDCNWEEDKPSDTKEKSSETKDKYSREALDEQLNDSLRSTVCTDKSKVKWDDVAGLDMAKKELQMAAEMPNWFPKLFTGKREPRRFILLYGPPGTGKGHLVKALASGVDSTLIVISSSDVQSKWSGESERLVRLVFENARRKKPSIIFFDEVEALCSSRTDSSSEHDNRVKTEFLVQMDGTAHDNTGILFVAATNLPWKLDSAFRRRLQKKIHIALPDKEARRRIFRIKVGDTPCNVSTADYEEFATKTEGFSGSDITNLVQEALMEPIIRIQEATHWRKVSHRGKEKLTTCRPDEEGAKAMNWRDVPENELLDPTVDAQDFYNALAKAKSSVGKEELQRYDDWTKQYGMEGA